MASQKAKQKRTPKRKSTRTGRPKAPDPPPVNRRPRPIPTYRDAPELLGPGQPGDGSRDRQWVYPNDDNLYCDENAGLISLPTIPEGDEGGDGLREHSDIEEHEESKEDGEEFDSDHGACHQTD